MKTLLGIVASPRKYGNSELLVKEVHRCLKGEWRLRLARLPELNIGPCRACYKCLSGSMRCARDDDFGLVLDALVHCDAYAVAAPAYFLGANASLKRLLDRGLAFYAHAEALWGKPAVGLAVAGIEGKEGYTKLVVDSFVKLALGDHRGSEVVYGALPGEVFLEGEGKAAAARLARALEEGREEEGDDVPRCSLCGSDTFRFLPGGRARCMLCSSSGKWRVEGGRWVPEMDAGSHPLFLTCEDVTRHREWLKTMKDRFMTRREELKAVAKPYAGRGAWLSRDDSSR